MGHLVLWDHVLWSFLLGFTPLTLALGWKLISSVGDPFHLASDRLRKAIRQWIAAYLLTHCPQSSKTQISP